jgi:hypothetical protein
MNRAGSKLGANCGEPLQRLTGRVLPRIRAHGRGQLYTGADARNAASVLGPHGLSTDRAALIIIIKEE